MASLLIATPLLHSDALRSRAMIAGSQGQKTSRVSCRACVIRTCRSCKRSSHTHQTSVASAPARRRSERVIFTEEKARRLRQENRATQTFHDKWYHSAIASRLATPE